MKTDGFGITHDDRCRDPHWSIVNDHTTGASVQRCRSCGIKWHNGDPALTARPIAGYTSRPTTIARSLR